MAPNYSVIIPARYASSRLPGKPLLQIEGKSMVQHVYEQAMRSNAERVVIATDDQRIVEEAAVFGGHAVMTSASHISGTDRLHEVVTMLGLNDQDIVVNVQGDEPLIPPQNIDQVAALLANSNTAGVATLCESINNSEEIFNPNVVKVVADPQGKALYFSRAPIPWDRGRFAESGEGIADTGLGTLHQRHIGIYAYRVAFLRQFVQWPVAAIEAAESLEQLRAMANGVEILVAPAVATPPPGVDTQEDLEHVRALLAAGKRFD